MPSRILKFDNEYDKTVTADQGLSQLFYRQVRETPEAVAVIDGDTAFTYSQLHVKASYLASKLSALQLRSEEPVGILVERGVGDILAQLAILYAAGTCVPLDVALPDNQVHDRLERLDARHILTDDINRCANLPFTPICIKEELVTKRPKAEHYPFPRPTSIDHRTHVFHTSGTTAQPKAVQVTARSILHVILSEPTGPLHSTDVVAYANNSSFDMGLYDIWASILRGARCVVLSKSVLIDPPAMAREIGRLGITVMVIPTALLNLAASTYPQAFGKLRTCIFGGEAANIAAVKTILDEAPPELLVNAYGPTETCIWCTAHQITPEAIRDGFVSIGKPIGHTTAYIIDETGQPSDEGELWIGGPGVSAGYINQPEKTAAVFIPSATLPWATEKTSSRLYRTGDIVRRRPDGLLDYVGRRDHQVKIRGFRIELGAVEDALLKTGLFAEVTALQIETPIENAAGSILVAYAVPAESASQGSVAEDATPLVRKVLPNYMVPQLEIIFRMPLNSNGKVDRWQLKELFAQRWQRLTDINCSLDTPGKDVYSRLAGLWSSILGTSPSAYGDDSDFLLLGGTSLQAALLINRIRSTFGIEISLLTLYANSTLMALTAAIEKSLAGQSEAVHVKSEKDLWLADSCIADDIPSPSEQAVDWTLDTEGRIFLTGATGFVGAFLLAEVLDTSNISQVACLVRAEDAKAALERIRVAMHKYGIWKDEYAHRIIAIAGSLEDEYFGLLKDQYDELSRWASVVFHLGARVNYTLPYSLHRPANTIGTYNVVRFACASAGRTKAVHYVSSIACFGPTGCITGAKTLSEEEPLLPHLDAVAHDHGYSQSQWVVDELMRRLQDRGFPVTIYRPGFVTGHSATGACNPDDFLSRVIKGCFEIGCFPQLPRQRKEFVPVDYVVKAILHISQQQMEKEKKTTAKKGRVYHLVPKRDRSQDISDFMALVGKIGNVSMRSLPYSEWAEKLMMASPECLLPLQPMLTEKVLGGKTRWELYENMPTYETSNTDEALEGYTGGLEVPVIDSLLITKYLAFLDVGKGCS